MRGPMCLVSRDCELTNSLCSSEPLLPVAPYRDHYQQAFVPSVAYPSTHEVQSDKFMPLVAGIAFHSLPKLLRPATFHPATHRHLALRGLQPALRRIHILFKLCQQIVLQKEL
jgi:hypothetical protein